MAKESGSAFDLGLLRRILASTKPYRKTFFGTGIAAILLTVFSLYTPMILREIVDKAIKLKDSEYLLTLSLAMLGVLLGQVVCQVLFTFYANWLGETVIKDMRKDLFNRMLGFRMEYYNKSSIGVLVKSFPRVSS